MEEDKIHQLFMGLDDESFSIVHSQLLVTEPVPSMEKIVNMVQQEENYKNTMLNR